MRIRTWLAIGAFVLAAFVGWRVTAANAPHPCRRVTFEEDRFVVCEADLARDEVRLAWGDAKGVALRSFGALAETLDTEKLLFAMNAGMFDEAGRPIGLYVEHGQQKHAISTTDGPGNFHMKPNGVFSIGKDGVARVETSEAFITRGETPAWATQSGPMLVIAGELHPGIQPDGPSRYVRNGVGVRDGAHVVFVISSDAVSFGKLARLFRDVLHCPDALYFDGSVSSLWAPSLGRRDEREDLGPFAVVSRRQR